MLLAFWKPGKCWKTTPLKCILKIEHHSKLRVIHFQNELLIFPRENQINRIQLEWMGTKQWCQPPGLTTVRRRPTVVPSVCIIRGHSYHDVSFNGHWIQVPQFYPCSPLNCFSFFYWIKENKDCLQTWKLETLSSFLLKPNSKALSTGREQTARCAQETQGLLRQNSLPQLPSIVHRPLLCRFFHSLSQTLISTQLTG